MISIDGGFLEGGGQIVRTATALSAITGKEFEIYNIRAKRCNPGLRPQHVLGIKAAAELCSAELKGAFAGSGKVYFKPSGMSSDKISIKLDTAGSITLIMQTLLPICVFSEKAKEIKINGGATAGQWCPSFEYFENVFLKNLALMGLKKPEINANKRGYYPEGGADISVKIFPSKITPADLTSGFSVEKISCISEASLHLKKAEVAERQAKAFSKALLDRFEFKINSESVYHETLGYGSAVTSFLKTGAGTYAGASSIGERGKTSEKVGVECAKNLINEIEKKALIDRFCADQLMIFMALAGEGSVKTSEISNHVLTNAEIIEKFLPVKFNISTEESVIRVSTVH